MGVVHKLSLSFSLVLLALLMAPLLSGCSSSGSSPLSVGSASGQDAYSGPAIRQQQRTDSRADSFSPGYRKYLVRLAERRASLGLPLPPEFRIAVRRERYKDVFDVFKATKSVLADATQPVTRHIPYLAPVPDSTDLTSSSLLGLQPTTTRAATSFLFRPRNPAVAPSDR